MKKAPGFGAFFIMGTFVSACSQPGEGDAAPTAPAAAAGAPAAEAPQAAAPEGRRKREGATEGDATKGGDGKERRRRSENAPAAPSAKQ